MIAKLLKQKALRFVISLNPVNLAWQKYSPSPWSGSISFYKFPAVNAKLKETIPRTLNCSFIVGNFSG